MVTNLWEQVGQRALCPSARGSNRDALRWTALDRGVGRTVGQENCPAAIAIVKHSSSFLIIFFLSALRIFNR